GDKPGQPMSNGAMLRVRDRMVKDGLIKQGTVTTHGIARACFKSWASDETNFERDIVEACLTHVIGDKLGAPDAGLGRFRRGQDWRQCDKPARLKTSAPDAVVSNTAPGPPETTRQCWSDAEPILPESRACRSGHSRPCPLVRRPR